MRSSSWIRWPCGDGRRHLHRAGSRRGCGRCREHPNRRRQPPRAAVTALHVQDERRGTGGAGRRGQPDHCRRGPGAAADWRRETAGRSSSRWRSRAIVRRAAGETVARAGDGPARADRHRRRGRRRDRQPHGGAVARARVQEALELAAAAASVVIHRLGTTGTASREEIAALFFP